MPPYLAIPHFHLSKLPVTTKVALTVFTLSLLAGLAFVAFAVFESHSGYTTQGVQINYAGSERYAKETGDIQDRMVAEKSKDEVHDFVVHPHSFTIPIVFFILCHLMEMCFAPRRLKLLLYLASGVAMLAVIFTPALVLVSLPAAVILVPAAVALFVSFAVMAILPTWQMWFMTAPASESPR